MLKQILGLDDMNINIPNLTKKIERRIAKDLNNVRTVTPATVKKVYPESMKVDVELKVKTTETPISIDGVRLVYPQSNNHKFLFGIEKGDIVLLLFNKFDVISLQRRGTIRADETPTWRLHNVVALPGIHLDQLFSEKYDESSINNNDVKIPDGINILSEDEILISGNNVRFDSEIELSGDGKMVRRTWLDIGALPKSPQEQPPPVVRRGTSAALELEDGKKRGVFGKIRIPDRIDANEPLVFKILWDTPVTDEDCVWELEYGCYEDDDDMTVIDAFDTFITTSSSNSNGLVKNEYEILDDSYDRDDLFFAFRLTRLGDDGDDTINDDVYLHGIGIDYYVTQIGGYEI